MECRYRKARAVCDIPRARSVCVGLYLWTVLTCFSQFPCSLQIKKWTQITQLDGTCRVTMNSQYDAAAWRWLRTSFQDQAVEQGVEGRGQVHHYTKYAPGSYLRSHEECRVFSWPMSIHEHCDRHVCFHFYTRWRGRGLNILIIFMQSSEMGMVMS